MQAKLKIDNATLTTVERVQRGDYKGLNFVGLARLSFEIDPDRDYSGVPVTGLDLNKRGEQEKAERDYIEARGGTYIGTIHEADTSAYKQRRVKLEDGTYAYRVIRPKFERILKNLKLGTLGDSNQDITPDLPRDTPIHGLIVFVDDRLTRNNRHLEDAIEVVEHFDRPIIDVSRTLDLLTENGRDVARIMVTMNRKQSAATARRMRDNHKLRAMNGIPSGGHRPFGWEEDKRTLRPSEARLIKEAAEQLVDGVYAGTIVRKWNKKGYLTSTGARWRRRTFVQMMCNPRIAGIRTYGPKSIPVHERYLVDADGNPVMGQWEAILDIPTWQEVVDILAGPDRPGAHEYIGKLKYPCSGKVVCGLCGCRCNAHAKGKYYYYSCKTDAEGGCGKISGSGNAIDRIVAERVKEHLAKSQVTIKAQPWGREEELNALRDKRKKLLAQYDENEDMGPVIFPKIRQTDKEIAALTKERAAHARKTKRPKDASIVERWDTLEVEQQRAIIYECVEAIVLMPAKKHSNKFDEGRLKVVMKELSLEVLRNLVKTQFALAA